MGMERDLIGGITWFKELIGGIAWFQKKLIYKHGGEIMEMREF